MRQKQQKKPINSSELIRFNRDKNRSQYFQQIRKTSRFQWDVKETLKHLQSVSYRYQETLDIIDDVLQNPTDQKIGHLVQLVALADIKIKIGAIARCVPMIQMIQDKISTPQGVMLLGNLASIFQQFQIQANRKQLHIKVAKIMNQLRRNSDLAVMYSWTLTHLTKSLRNLHPDTIQKLLPFIYNSLNECNSSSNHFTYLICVVSYLSHYTVFPEQFTLCIFSHLFSQSKTGQFGEALKKLKDINKMNIFIIIVAQLKNNKKFSSKMTDLYFRYITKGYEQLPQKIKAQHTNFYELLCILIQKSGNELCDEILEKMPGFLTEYKYHDFAYLSMIFSLITKAYLNEDKINKLIKDTGIIQNIVYDINDHNSQIGFNCLKIVGEIISILRINGWMTQLEWMISVGVEKNILAYIEDNRKNQAVEDLAQSILEVLSTVR